MDAFYALQQEELKEVLIDDLAKLTMTYIKDTVVIRDEEGDTILEIAVCEARQYYVKTEEEHFEAFLKRSPNGWTLKAVRMKDRIHIWKNQITGVLNGYMLLVKIDTSEWKRANAFFVRNEAE
jgi:hypothetical protein